MTSPELTPRPAEVPSGITATVSRNRLHLLGAGKVGRSFLSSFDRSRHCLVGLSDRSATRFDRTGLDADELAEFKGEGNRLADYPGSGSVPLTILLRLFPIDIVVDATDSDPRFGVAALARAIDILDSGKRLVLASKNALLVGAEHLFDDRYRGRVGINAVLGGTGRVLVAELAELRANTDEISIVGNATTTRVIEAIEAGDDLTAGIEAARRTGLLEADPTQDLDGTDLAIKAIIVGSIIFGGAPKLDELVRPSAESLDPERIAWRRRRGKTTRLVARIRGGDYSIRYEELHCASHLAVSSQRVSYAYGDRQGAKRVIIGSGIGPLGTARAIGEDVDGDRGPRDPFDAIAASLATKEPLVGGRHLPGDVACCERAEWS